MRFLTPEEGDPAPAGDRVEFVQGSLQQIQRCVETPDR